MARTRATWNQKLEDSKGLPKMEPMPEKWRERWGEGQMLIPAPLEVNALMCMVPKDKLTTIEQIRECLARKHGAAVACPMTTGIFTWIAAHAASESEEAGVSDTTPYWRTLKAKGELNPKYPGGIAHLSERLRLEGHHIIQRGKRWFVADLKGPLFTPKIHS